MYIRRALILALLGAGPICAGGNLIVNGDFSKGMAGWQLSNPGGVVAAPGEKGNRALRVDRIEEIFGLSQQTKIAARAGALTVRFRALATKATAENPVQLRFRLYDARGNSVVAGWRLTTSRRWTPLSFTFGEVPDNVVSVLLENNRGEGSVYVDDLVLQ